MTDPIVLAKLNTLQGLMLTKSTGAGGGVEVDFIIDLFDRADNDSIGGHWPLGSGMVLRSGRVMQQGTPDVLLNNYAASAAFTRVESTVMSATRTSVADTNSGNNSFSSTARESTFVVMDAPTPVAAGVSSAAKYPAIIRGGAGVICEIEFVMPEVSAPTYTIDDTDYVHYYPSGPGYIYSPGSTTVKTRSGSAVTTLVDNSSLQVTYGYTGGSAGYHFGAINHYIVAQTVFLGVAIGSAGGYTAISFKGVITPEISSGQGSYTSAYYQNITNSPSPSFSLQASKYAVLYVGGLGALNNVTHDVPANLPAAAVAYSHSTGGVLGTLLEAASTSVFTAGHSLSDAIGQSLTSGLNVLHVSLIAGRRIAKLNGTTIYDKSTSSAVAPDRVGLMALPQNSIQALDAFGIAPYGVSSFRAWRADNSKPTFAQSGHGTYASDGGVKWLDKFHTVSNGTVTYNPTT